MTFLGSNIIKGGALLDDSRRLVEAWDTTLSQAENLALLSEGNLLGKRSRSRTTEVLAWSLRPRLVDAGDHVIPALKGLVDHPTAFREACFYETARVEPLLAVFAEESLWNWYEEGRTLVRTEDVASWLDALARAGRVRAWSESVRARTAQGLVSTMRDFGVLEGKALKRFAVPRMTPEGFAYAAFREHEQGRSDRAIADGTLWRRWLLDVGRVGDLLAQAERLGVLRFSKVGSAVRIDWRLTSLAEVTGAA